jgi:hypothetical protein
MRDTPERDLAVAHELASMADARIKELESERDALLSEVAQLRDTLDQSARTPHAVGWTHSGRFEECERHACVTARALLAKER